MKNLIIDIDGTLCPIKKDERYSSLIPYKKMIEKITEYKNMGFKIILFTSRNMRTYDGDVEKILKYTKPELEIWLKKWNIPYDEVIYGKPYPGENGFYIDDRTVRPNEFLNNSFQELNNICKKDKKINNTVSYTFKVNDTNVLVKSNEPKLIKDLIRKYGFYYEIGGNNPDYTINYIVGTSETTECKFKEKDGLNYNYIEGDSNQLNIYMKEYQKNDENFTKRIFTSSLIKILQKKGYVIMHAACVAKDGKGIVISGGKRSGKTTTLLNFLNRGYDFIANDRIAVKKENDHITIVGIPFSMGVIYEDAVKLFDVSDCHFDIDNDKRKAYLSNDDISRKFNVSVDYLTKLNLILLPKYNPTISKLKLNKEQDVISYLGEENIMTDNSIHEEKRFLNDIICNKYQDPEFLKEVDSIRVEQSANTFDELDLYVKSKIGGKKYVLRSSHTFN